MQADCRVLTVMGGFKLPDDFEGDFPDALRAWAEYLDSDGASNPDRVVDNEGDVQCTWGKIWHDFNLAVDEGFKSSCAVSIARYDKASNKMIRLVERNKGE